LPYLRRIPATLLAITILVISIIIFSFWITKVSIFDEFYQLESGNVKNEINVYENFNGIPHIVSKNEMDLYFTIGYYHAKDRLWQMDIMRRAAEGRLSEVFGEKTFKQDLFFRSIDIKKYAKSTLDSISSESMGILKSYSNGINAFVNENRSSLQFEFGALDYYPDKWTPYHSILISKLVAFEMSFSFWSDFAISEITTKLGKSKANHFIPGSNNNNSFSDIQLPMIDSSFISELVNSFGTGRTGSNSWAINYKRNDSISSILANDPHLPITIPPRWYQMHVTSENINSTGYSIPGIPLCIVGRNDSISWGITNVMADVCDLYLVKKGKNDDFYIGIDGNETEFIFERDTIRIKNSDDYQYYKRATDMSSVLSKNHIWNTDSITSSFFKDYDICFDWTSKNPSDEILSLYNINTATNYSDFKGALTTWNAPALTFHYADKNGNISRIAAGNIPIREKTAPNIFNPHWLPEYRWKGRQSLLGMGEKSIMNKKGSVFSANNKYFKESIFISNNWEPNSRANRINQLISNTDVRTVRDSEFMQMDNFSPFANIFKKLTLPTLEKIKSKLNSNEKKALEKLKRWNNILSKDINEPLIYNYFKRELINQTIKDELGEDLYRNYVYLSNFPDRLILELLKTDNHILFDNIKTDKKENKELIIVRAFKNSVKKLIGKYGIDGIRNLPYGKVHKLNLNHFFSDNEFMSPAVSLKPVGLGGDNTTLFNTGMNYNKPNEVLVSASMRFITDMSDSLVYMIFPGGNSGDPMSPNYGDQVQLWLNGGYLKLSVSPKPNIDFELKTRITPK
jgi:penicillin amidase